MGEVAHTYIDGNLEYFRTRRTDYSLLKLSLLCMTIFISACHSRQPVPPQVTDNQLIQDEYFSKVKYAKGFRVEKNDVGTILILSDPLNIGKEIARYRLLKAESSNPPLSGYIDIVVPVQKLAASSTTHAGFLAALGARDQLMGCNNPERLYDTLLFNRFLNGSLLRMGRDLDYNLEFLISNQPDLVLQTGIDGQFNPDERLTEVGIPVMFVLEWMESTPLGRAEWIKVFGQITGKVGKADSLFNVIEKKYNDLATLGHSTDEKVRVLTGNVFQGTWYMPGGRNYMTRFFEDAGMDYLWKETDQSASLALSFESVVYQLADAPIWINVNIDSLSGLLASEERYSVFRALREKRVFSVFNRTNSHGGNDFWEGAVVRPDQVLEDLLAIAHPEMIPDHDWNYYKPLKLNK
jgi:iron complex transport system substrate-binding protein